MNWQIQPRVTIDRSKDKPQFTKQVRVLYRGTVLALFQDPKTNMIEEAKKYLKVYGYMAEYRRRWLLEGYCNWTDDLLVTDLEFELMPCEIPRDA